MIPLTNHGFQWGRSEVVIIYPDVWGCACGLRKTFHKKKSARLESNTQKIKETWPVTEITQKITIETTLHQTILKSANKHMIRISFLLDSRWGWSSPSELVKQDQKCLVFIIFVYLSWLLRFTKKVYNPIRNPSCLYNHVLGCTISYHQHLLINKHCNPPSRPHLRLLSHLSRVPWR